MHFSSHLGIIGYWTTAFAAIVIVEHLVFRKRDLQKYNTDHWDNPRKLPSGVAAVFAFFGAIGVVIPCMSQAWYVGPIAKHTGDIGIIVGFFVATGLYSLLRYMEITLLQSE